MGEVVAPKCARCGAPLGLAFPEGTSAILRNVGLGCPKCGHTQVYNGTASAVRIGGRLGVVIEELTHEQLSALQATLRSAVEQPNMDPETVAAAVEPIAPGIAAYILEFCDKYQGLATVLSAILGAIAIAISLTQGGDHDTVINQTINQTINHIETGQTLIVPPGMPKRRQPCWCGSGKRYKNCHGREDAHYKDVPEPPR